QFSGAGASMLRFCLAGSKGTNCAAMVDAAVLPSLRMRCMCPWPGSINFGAGCPTTKASMCFVQSSPSYSVKVPEVTMIRLWPDAFCRSAPPRRTQLGENILVQKLVAEFSLRIVFLRELHKLRHLFMAQAKYRRLHREQFSPMRLYCKRRQRSLNFRQDRLHRRPVLLPGEMNRHRI